MVRQCSECHKPYEGSALIKKNICLKCLNLLLAAVLVPEPEPDKAAK